jgi:hypothetical protein
MDLYSTGEISGAELIQSSRLPVPAGATESRGVMAALFMGSQTRQRTASRVGEALGD